MQFFDHEPRIVRRRSDFFGIRVICIAEDKMVRVWIDRMDTITKSATGLEVGVRFDCLRNCDVWHYLSLW
jgi:hypothetical protein